MYLFCSNVSPFELLLAHATLGIITLCSEEISIAARQHPEKTIGMCARTSNQVTVVPIDLAFIYKKM
jgi:hypothetical protein